MERKTQIHAEDGKQDILITREFDLPLELLFRAYAEPELVSQWMGTRVLHIDNRPQGGYAFETKDKDGNVMFAAQGTIHAFVPDQMIVRTFEMAHAGFGVQLEYLEFEALGEETSKLSMQTIFRSVALRDAQMKLPFAQGLNWAHGRLEEIVRQLVR
ncbi:SRPBCC domain-containing protein [Taibaiella koreensis]|uniref:SRPBCC domain-containing protein n=1 Tax=Taibaiella koreensis TaxID=1268548 RepID=UPI000E59DB53|nr:SRPBCC domain-containing protein [Taibaiella koreensis]